MNSAKRKMKQLKYRKDFNGKYLLIQRVIRGFLGRSLAKSIRNGLIQFQSLFRGHKVRRNRPLHVKKIATRIRSANEKALSQPQFTLSERTSSALQSLQTSKRLAEIMRAVITLEVSTRLSKTCCISVAEANAPRTLYSLIRSCNRSLPHIELLQFVLMTLVNISNHSSLLPSVATQESIDVTLDLVQMFRDKEIIFCLTTLLLERIALSDKKFLLRCAKRESERRIRGVHSMTQRKLSEAKKTPSHRKSSEYLVIPGYGRRDMKSAVRSLERIMSNFEQ